MIPLTWHRNTLWSDSCPEPRPAILLCTPYLLYCTKILPLPSSWAACPAARTLPIRSPWPVLPPKSPPSAGDFPLHPSVPTFPVTNSMRSSPSCSDFSDTDLALWISSIQPSSWHTVCTLLNPLNKGMEWEIHLVSHKQDSSPSVQFSSVTQSCPTLCDPMNLSTPGLPVHHQLLESTQTHVHRVSDAISSSIIPFSCPQSFPASGFFPMSQLFPSGGQSTGV